MKKIGPNEGVIDIPEKYLIYGLIHEILLMKISLHATQNTRNP
jgi:hypothetical protein